MATVTEVGPRLGIAPTCAALGLPTGDLLPAAPAPACPSAAAALASGALRRRAGRRARGAPRAAVRGPRARRGLRDPPRRGPVPLLRADDVPPPGGPPGGAGAAEPAPASALRGPGAAARRPNQLWSWDITKLLGPAKWTYFYLYVILDVFSRYVVGWMVAHRESAALAERLIRETVRPAGNRPRAAHHPCRPRAGDDLEARGAAPGRPGRHQDPCPPARLQRQPVLGGAVQDEHLSITAKLRSRSSAQLRQPLQVRTRSCTFLPTLGCTI